MRRIVLALIAAGLGGAAVAQPPLEDGYGNELPEGARARLLLGR